MGRPGTHWVSAHTFPLPRPWHRLHRLTPRPSNLAAAIERIVERIAQGTLDALPPYTPPSFPVSAADRVTLFDWMVLTCYPDELAHQQHLADLAGEGPMTNGNGANQQEGEGAGMLQLD